MTSTAAVTVRLTCERADIIRDFTEQLITAKMSLHYTSRLTSTSLRGVFPDFLPIIHKVEDGIAT